MERRAFPFLVAANFGVPLAFYPLYGWNAVLIAGALRTAALMTATGMVNSVCHKWGSRDNVKQPKTTVHFAARQLVPNQPLRQTHREWHIKEPPEIRDILAA